MRQRFSSIKASDAKGEGKEQLCKEQESDVGGKVGDNDGGDVDGVCDGGDVGGDGDVGDGDVGNGDVGDGDGDGDRVDFEGGGVGEDVVVGGKVGNNDISKVMFVAVMFVVMLVLIIMVMHDCKGGFNHCPLMVLSIIAHSII